MPLGFHNPKRSAARAIALGAVCAAALLAGCGGSDTDDGGAANADGKTVITYGTQGGYVNTPGLADALGYLPNITLKPVTNGATIPPAQFVQTVLKGQVTFGFSTFNALVAANAHGQRVKAVIGFSGELAKDTGSILVSSKSDLRTAKDLVGKKIGVIPGSTGASVFDLYLHQAGLSPDAAKQVSVSYASDSGEQSVRKGDLVAFHGSGAPLRAARERGGLRELVSDREVLGPVEANAYFFSADYIAKHRKAVAEFVAGTAKAIEWSRSHTPAEVLAVYGKYLRAHGQADLVDGLKGWTGNGTLKGGLITKRSFDNAATWLGLRQGLKPGTVKPTDVITNEFNPYAGS